MNGRNTVVTILVVILVLAGVCAQAATYYVAVGGSDANDGSSWEEAFATIQKGIDSAGSGDTVIVAEGTYYETIDFNSVACTVTSTNPEDWGVVADTIIDANDPNTTVVVFENGEDANSMLTGFTIRNAHCGVLCSGSCSPVISRCFIEDNENFGIWAATNSAPDIRDNIIRNNGGTGIYCYKTAGPLIVNNLIYDNATGISVYNSSSQAVVSNNTVVSNSSTGIARHFLSNTPSISNCIIWDNGSNSELVSCTATYSCIKDPNDASGTGNISGDANEPCFVDADANDFHIEPNSPCIDAGDPNSDANDVGQTDVGGDDRFIDGDWDSNGVARIDMGAYEFQPKVRVFTSDAYDDNDGEGLRNCQVHFTHRLGTGGYGEPNLYIEAEVGGGDRTCADELENIPITSDSDPNNGITVDFTEDANNSGIYHCEAIHLAEDSNQTNRELKVLNEETLYVKGVPGAKVDRGEVATITIALEAPQQEAADGAADELDEFLDKDEPNNPGDYHWWDGGEERGETDGFADFIKDVGNSQSSFPADILFQSSHGGYGNIGEQTDYFELYKPNDHPDEPNDPCVAPADWTVDIEWAIFWSCNVLGQYGSYTWHRMLPESDATAWVTFWDDALVRGSGVNNCHGILASADLLYFEAPDVMVEFCEAIRGNGTTVLDAWMAAALEVTDVEWGMAALFHKENKDDYLDDVTEDTNDPAMYYTWYVEDDNEPNVHEWGGGFKGASVGFGQAAVTIDYNIPTERPFLHLVEALRETPTLGPYDPSGFDCTRFDKTGRSRFAKHLQDDGPVLMSKTEARDAAELFVQDAGGGMPSDANLWRSALQNAGTYNASEPEETWRQYVKKYFFEYNHSIGSMDVVGDRILVGIERDRVVWFDRHWRTIVGPVGDAMQVISAEDVLDVAIENIPGVFLQASGGYAITDIKLFYYGPPSEDVYQYLVPAWGFEVNGRSHVYVDAFSGEFLR